MFLKTELKEAYDEDGCFDGFEYEEATGPFAVWTCYWQQLGSNAAWVAEVEPGTQIYPMDFDGVVLLGFAADLAAAEEVAAAARREAGDTSQNVRGGKWGEVATPRN